MTKPRKQRGRKAGSRRDKAEQRQRADVSLHIQRGRELFSFLTATKGPDGRMGTIDQDICDGVGQLHAVGLLSNPTHDPQDLRDKAREWGLGYTVLMRGQGVKVSKLERADKSHAEPTYTKRDKLWDQMDLALTGFERGVLMDLIVDPLIGTFGELMPHWAQSLIDEQLLKRGRINQLSQPMRFPTASDRDYLEAAIRGMQMLVDATGRREQKAA